MDGIEQLTASADPLLVCCLGEHLLCEAEQLECLHNCCRKCFNTAALSVGNEGVSCLTCGLTTQVGNVHPNTFIDSQVGHYRAMVESRVCGMCKSNNVYDKPAMVWCAACQQSLCGDCIDGHKQYNCQHVTQSLEELSIVDMFRQPPPLICAIHKKPLDVACRTCEQAMCISCWAECHEKKHEMHVVGNESFDNYVDIFISSISNMESELLRKSEVLQKPKGVLRDMQVARDLHLEEISARKRRVADAVEKVYQEIEFSTKNFYDELEAEGHATAAVAVRIDTEFSHARNYIRCLIKSDQKCQILNQQKIVRERLRVLSAEMDSLQGRMNSTNREVKIESSLPEVVEDVVRAWIGIPGVHAAPLSPSSSQPQQQSFAFGSTQASFKLPVNCVDVALMPDGRSLLLAAWQNGLIELSSASGQELTHWRAPKHSSSSADDWVQAVAALSAGRAAVSLHFARLVVLLRRSKSSSSSSSTSRSAVAAAAAEAGQASWTEDCRFDQLAWNARWLSAHGDVLAACEWGGKRLQLLSLSSRMRLSDMELQREYKIGCLAVADRTVVTGSRRKVKLSEGRKAAHVLDAHRIETDGGSDKRLWRHALNAESGDRKQEEQGKLSSVCTDFSGGCLYAAVSRSEMTNGSLSVLSLADGNLLRRFALSFYSVFAAAPQPLPLLLPMRLSLCDDRAAEQEVDSIGSSRGRVLLLAALCRDPATQEWNMVTLHSSISTAESWQTPGGKSGPNQGV